MFILFRYRQRGQQQEKAIKDFYSSDDPNDDVNCSHLLYILHGLH